MEDWFDLFLIVALTIAGVAGVVTFLVVLLVLLLPLGLAMLAGGLIVESWRRLWCWWRRR